MLPFTMETGRSTCVGVIKPELYSASLRSMCRQNEWQMNRLKAQVDSALPPTGKPGAQDGGNQTQSSWEKRDVMFTSADTLTNFGDNRSVGSETESMDSIKGQQPSFCYLCSTMEEHANHHAKKVPRKPGKARVVYLAPPPIVRRKKETKPPPIYKEALYKVDVYTADKPHASTDAQVYITIEGSEDVLPRTKLHKSIGCAKFSFCRGTTESFYVKAPKLGNLETLLIEHDGVEEKHGWCLEKVEVTDMATKDTWIFVCGKWLSLHIKDFKTKRRLKAAPKEVIRSEYKIVVHTGKKAFSGTDANVFITLFGQKRNSPKVLLKDPSQKCFENGRVDSFQVGLPELGKLNKIRIEHDGKGMAPGWFLDHVVIYNVATPTQKFYCYCNSWLSRDEGDGRLWKILPARNKPRTSGKAQDEDKVKYEVKVLTGDVKYAGTDANVFIQMIGVNGATSEIPLDDARNNFERNMVDVFTVRAEDVGSLERILIGHDNSGPGAGWFLERVTVRRYPPKRKESSGRRSHFVSRSERRNDQVVRIRNKRNQDYTDLEKSESLGIVERQILSELQEESELIRRNKWAVPEVRRHSDGEFSDWSDSAGSDSDSTTTRSKKSQNRPVSSYQRRDGTRQRNSETRKKSVSISERRKSIVGARRQSTIQDGRPGSEMDEVESRRKSEQTTPLYEEYEFYCHQWLSADEGDRQTVRELTCQGKTDHFED